MRFAKGQSGNPGGQSKIAKNIRDLARQHRPEAIAALVAALESPGERVPAANTLLAYSDGKPAANVNIRVITSVRELEMIAREPDENPMIEYEAEATEADSQ